MNRRMVINMVGKLILSEAALLLPALIVSIIYKEACLVSFIQTIIIAIILGSIMMILSRPGTKIIYAKEGFVIVAFSWIALSAIGALPFYFSGEIKHYADAFFETVSGFTTTGSSILTDVESMSKGLLFWRSFTHWVGGMGVLVFIMAILPNNSDRSIHIMKAEVPGPIVGKLLPKVRDTAKILYIIYLSLTAIEAIFLLLGGMTLFDSLVHSFGTAGTGGFGIKVDSIGGYSPYIQWVITIFMFIFSINFNLYYLILIGKAKSALRSTELWVFIAIVASAVGLITINISSMYPTISETIRHSAFQVGSIISTTGFTTTNFDLWPNFSKAILLLLMFCGACAGSTGGGIKVTRLIIVFKQIKREIKKMLHNRSVNVVKFEGKTLDDSTIYSATTYLSMYMLTFGVVFLIISLEPFGLESNFSAVVACINNIGPGFAAVGPTASFAEYSTLSKYVLSFAMLLGRLEIFPLLLALSPTTWSKKS